MPEHTVAPVESAVAGPHGPVPVRRYAPPAGATARPPIVWVHGGGFFTGDLDLPETHEVARALAAAGFPVVTVGYRLATIGPRPPSRRRAPSIRYPVPVDDVVAVLRAVQAEQSAQTDLPPGVLLGGASAGACLSAGAVLRLAADGAPPLAGVFFAYGFFHARLPELTREVRGLLRGRRKYTHLPALLDLTNLNYTGSVAALAEPFAFAGGHPLHGFPPVLMLDAESDSMRASGEQFARELTDAAVPVERRVLPGTAHAFLNRPREAAFARAIDLITGWAAGR